VALIRSNTSTAEWSNYNLGDYEEQKRDFLKDIQVEAEAILNKANEKAVLVLKEAYAKGREQSLAEIEVLKEKARKEGYNKGFIEGKLAGEKTGIESIQVEAAPVIVLLKNIAEKLEREASSAIFQAEEKLIQASMDLAEAVIDVEPKFNRDVLTSRLKKAVGYLRTEMELSVKVHPSDLDLAKKFLPQCLDELGVSPMVKWIEDDQMEVASVTVRSGESEVHFNQFLQWQKLLTLLKQKTLKQ